MFTHYVFSYISMLVSVSVLLARAIAERKFDMAPVDFISLWREGLGASSDHELINFREKTRSATAKFFISVLAANAFQQLYSFGYFMYNGTLTCMLVASELSHHGAEHKPLRCQHLSVCNDRLTFSLYPIALAYLLSSPLASCAALSRRVCFSYAPSVTILTEARILSTIPRVSDSLQSASLWPSHSPAQW